MKPGKTGKPIWSKNIIAKQRLSGIPSVEKLAEAADLPYPTVRDIVSGVSEGGYDKRLRLADALKCSVADFYKGGPDDKAIADVSAGLDLLSRFAGLEPVFQRMALSLIYQDTKYTKGIQITAAAQSEIQKLFGPLLKAKT